MQNNILLKKHLQESLRTTLMVFLIYKSYIKTKYMPIDGKILKENKKRQV